MVGNHVARLGGLVLMIMSVAGCNDMFMDEGKLMQRAKDYLQAGSINAAAIELRNALEENPENGEARYLLATIYLDFGDFATASKEFRRAIGSGMDNADVMTGLMRARLGLGEFDAVIADSKIDPQWKKEDRAVIHCMLALAYAGLERDGQANAELVRAQALDAGLAVVQRTAIQLQIAQGKHELAAKQLAKALDAYPDDIELLIMHAGLAGDRETSEQDYRKIISLDGDDFISFHGRMARLQLIQLLITDNALDEAELLLKPLYRRTANDPYADYLGGLIAFQRKDFEHSKQQLLKVLKVAPEHNPTRLLYATLNYAMGNYEQAAYFLDKYLLAVPDNLVARKLLARAYILLGQSANAAGVLAPVDLETADDAELLALAAMSELGMGRTESGLAGLEQAVNTEPESIGLRSELARAYIEAGETGLALAELQKVLSAGGEQRQALTLMVQAHLRARDFARAIDTVLGLVSQSPQDPAVQTLAGTVFAASGDADEARAYFRRATELQPGFAPAVLSLAQVEELEGNLAQAKTLYTRLVEMEPEKPLPMLALARIAEREADDEAVLGWLERAHQAAPGELEPRIYLAEYYLKAGNTTTARSYIREGLELFPGNPRLLALSGRVYIAMREYHAAIKPLQVLLEEQPESSTVRVLLSETYLQLGRFDDARRELSQVLEKNPDEVPARALLARLEIRAGEYDRALAHARHIQAIYPEHYLGYELAADSQMSAGSFDAAEIDYARAWERLSSGGLVIKRAENARRSGETGTAIGWLEDWFRVHPGDAEVGQHLGINLQNAGREAEAMTVYERVIVLDPDNAVALNNLAGLYLDEGREEALSVAKRAWLVDENNPAIQDTYGWALVQAGQVGRGLQQLKQARKGLPDIPEVEYHYAAALYRAGDRATARRLLRELLDAHAAFDGREDAERLLAAGN